MEKYGASEEELAEAREARNNAFKQMYMRQGGVQVLLEQIRTMDRKRDAMEEFEFKDYFFVRAEDKELRTAEEVEAE